MKIDERDFTAEKTYCNDIQELQDRYPDIHKACGVHVSIVRYI